MMFKTKLLSTALVVGLSAASMNVLAAPSSEVTLQGILTNTTCDVTINGGKSVLNVGAFNTTISDTDAGASFTAANTISKEQVNLPVTLTNCAKGQAGNLIIQGITSVGNNEQNVFVSNDAQTVGFIIQDTDGNDIVNGEGVPSPLGADDTTGQYTFKVGMATTNTTPKAGAYSAPIVIAFLSK
ncbi:TPA: fimbrial protein [Providencia rettgeri]